MGTDIHAVFQARKDGVWVDVLSNYDERRHYALFAWLANVRNGYGFAGVPTHKPIKPLLEESNGFPDDFEEIDGYHPTDVAVLPAKMRTWYDDEKLPDGRVKRYLADHTPCHLMAEQIVTGERPGKLQRVGVVDRVCYDKWDGVTPPDSWSGDISGPGIMVQDQPNDGYALMANTTHVRIRFETDDGYQYFIDEVQRLKDEHGEVRMVFGFDS